MWPDEKDKALAVQQSEGVIQLVFTMCPPWAVDHNQLIAYTQRTTQFSTKHNGTPRSHQRCISGICLSPIPHSAPSHCQGCTTEVPGLSGSGEQQQQAKDCNGFTLASNGFCRLQPQQWATYLLDGCDQRVLVGSSEGC
jgi:hypothetical protein